MLLLRKDGTIMLLISGSYVITGMGSEKQARRLQVPKCYHCELPVVDMHVVNVVSIGYLPYRSILFR